MATKPFEDERSQESNCFESDSALQGWTKDDKLALLDNLKFYGSNSIDQITQSMPEKSEAEIKAALAYYKSKSVQNPKVSNLKKKKERKKVNVVSRVPLGSWAKVLTDSINFKELQTETAAALHIIADFEDFPAPVSGSQQEHYVDFKKIYHILGNALEGKALPKNKVIATILEKCLLETALTSKAFIRKSTFKGVMKDLRVTEVDRSLLPRSTSKPELAAIRHLAHQRSYNPLNISENVLKQSIFSHSDLDNLYLL